MSQKHERARHEALARETGSWQSWAVQQWFTNGFMAVMLDEPSRGPSMLLEFECSCDDDARRDHIDDLSRPCVFLDVYERDPDAVGMVTNVLQKAGASRGSQLVTIEPDPFDHPDELGAVCYRARITGESAARAWVAVQKRYVDAIVRHAAPDRWAWFQLSVPGEKPVPPVIWALRGDRNLGVGLIMPMACTGSGVEAPTIEYVGSTP